MLCDRLWTDARLMTASPHLPGLGIIDKGAIAATQGKIVFAGSSHDLPANLEARETIPLSGRWVTPGFVDCHTHLIHAGNRSREFELRLAGATYEQIANEGGGILSTVKATRAATEDELVSLALPRLDDLIAEGVTTIEIKSGYGLTLEDELKQLRAARWLEHQRPISVTTTLLAAHTVPPEFSKQRQAYLNLIVDEILPRGIAEGLVDAVDAFCEKIAFTPEESAFLFEKARQHGIPVKLHADQLSDLGGAALAARFHALSADHLEFTNEESVQAMASAGTVAVLLPGAFYFLRETQLPPLAAFRKHGVPMAIATDMNPGSSPLTSLLLTLNFAATLFRMTVEECLLAVTRNGAKALGQLQHVGTIEVGKWCDLAIWEIERLAELVYRLGANPLHRRVWRGQ